MKPPPITSLLVLCSLHLFAQIEPVVPDTSSQFTLIKWHIETIDETYAGYINQYKNIAINEMYRTGIPASITLSQAILESDGGRSELAQQANNHFGIKCGPNWGGKTYLKLDDDKSADSIPVMSCFRKYDKAEESFYDHSEFFCDPAKHGRYNLLFLLDQTDYKNWARGLESAGYATSEGYAEKLINLIERYTLFQYDTIEATPSGSIGVEETAIKRIGYVNNVKAVWSRANERLEDIARTFGVDVEKLAEYNDHCYAPGFPLEPNTRIFIEEKKKKWRGRPAYHVVQEGQTMFDVSQQYGVKLSKLLERNGIEPNQEPLAGDLVRLRKRHFLEKSKSESGADISVAK